MPPCVDVYVLVRNRDSSTVLTRFIELYLATDQPDPRFEAFCRVYIEGRPLPGDGDTLADLRRQLDIPSQAFSLYLGARTHYAAIITITEEGDLVLGLSLDDPFNSAETVERAARLIDRLSQQFDVAAGLAGAELPPPQSLAEWRDDALVLIRAGIV